jgi:hypothetical protein
MQEPTPHFLFREVACDWRITPWPRPVAYRRWRNAHEWEPVAAPLTVWMQHPMAIEEFFGHRRSQASHRIAGQYELALPEDSPRRTLGGIGALLATIPEPYHSVFIALPAWHWSVLQLLARTRAARDLLLCNPALLVMLTPEALSTFLEVRPAVARSTQARLLPSKQTEALAALGFPATRAVRRMLQRIPAACCDVGNLVEFRRALRNGAHELLPLGHLRRLHAPVLSLVLDDIARPHVVPALLLEAAETEAETLSSLPGTRLRDCVLIARTLGREHLQILPRTLRELEQLHDELARDLELHQLAVHQRGQLREQGRARGEHARQQSRGQDRLEAPAEPPRRALPKSAARWVPPPPPPPPDPVELRKLAWKRWEERSARRSAFDAAPFPPPPFLPTEEIRFVPDRKALVALGTYFGNCSVAFAEPCSMREPSYAIYYMPVEDVMIGLRRRPELPGPVAWQLDQIEGRGYAPIARELGDRIRRWVAENGGDPGRTLGLRMHGIVVERVAPPVRAEGLPF